MCGLTRVTIKLHVTHVTIKLHVTKMYVDMNADLSYLSHIWHTMRRRKKKDNVKRWKRCIHLSFMAYI